MGGQGLPRDTTPPGSAPEPSGTHANPGVHLAPQGGYPGGAGRNLSLACLELLSDPQKVRHSESHSLNIVITLTDHAIHFSLNIILFLTALVSYQKIL